jgi:hypothetical protein
VVDQIKVGVDPERIEYNWQESLEQFRRLRAQFLLYASPNWATATNGLY